MTPSDTPRRSIEQGGLVGLALNRPVTVLCVTLAVLVSGVVALRRLPLQLMPGGLDFPVMFVLIPKPNSNPREVEEKITTPVEQMLGTVSGLRMVRSTSYENGARIFLQFHSEVDMDAAYVEVFDRLERVMADFPDGTERFSIRKFSPEDEPIFEIGVAYDDTVSHPYDRLRQQVLPVFEQTPGVASVSMEGMLERQVRLAFDIGKLQANRINLNTARDRLRREVFSRGAGVIREGAVEYTVQVDARFKSLDEIAAMPLSEHVRLGDVCEIREGYAIEQHLVTMDGRPMVEIDLSKESGANTIATCEAIEARVEAMRADPLLSGYRFEIAFSQGELVEGSLTSLRDSLIWGGVFALAVLLIFLQRLRLTLLVTLSIPASMTVALVCLFFMGKSLNLLSLMGLTLAVGMLIDNSIVVVESIFHQRERGMSARQAAYHGAREVALAIVMATSTTIVVFLPLWILSDNALFSFFLAEIGYPVCLSLAASLAVALGLIPLATVLIEQEAGPLRLLAGAYAGRHPVLVWAIALLLSLPPLLWAIALFLSLPPLLWAVIDRDQDGDWLFEPGLMGSAALGLWAIAALAAIGGRFAPVASRRQAIRQRGARAVTVVAGVFERGLLRARLGYLRALEWALAHRWEMLALMLLIGLVTAKIFTGMSMSDQGEGEERRFDVFVSMPENYTWIETRDLLNRWQQQFLEDAVRRELDLQSLQARFRPGWGRFRFYLTDEGEATLPQKAIEAKVRERFPEVPGVQFRLGWHGGGAGRGNAGTQIMVQGIHADRLLELAKEIERRLTALPSVLSVNIENAETRREMHLKLNRDVIEQLGVDPFAVGSLLSHGLAGSRLGDFRTVEGDIPMYMEFQAEEAPSASDLRKLVVPARAGASVPLDAIARAEVNDAPGELQHQDRRATMLISVKTHEPDLAKLQRDLERALASLAMPPGYEWKLGERFQMWAQDQAFGAAAALASVIFVFLLMGVLFESFLLPLCVLISIPAAGIGALGLLWLVNEPMDAMGWMGIVILVGIVVNNAIVLVDKINRLRLEGAARSEALRQAAFERFRPILMTAGTTVFGLLPMAFGRSAGVISYAALGKCVMGGMISSTALTLFLVPLFYTVFDDLREAGRRNRVLGATLVFGGLAIFLALMAQIA